MVCFRESGTLFSLTQTHFREEPYFFRSASFCISPEMAIRLSKAFDTSSESWLNQQMHFDLWLAKQKTKTLKIAKLIAA